MDQNNKLSEIFIALSEPSQKTLLQFAEFLLSKESLESVVKGFTMEENY
jgi:hypothetical protein